MTSAPATMAIGRSRIEALAASVSRACTCFSLRLIVKATSRPSCMSKCSRRPSVFTIGPTEPQVDMKLELVPIHVSASYMGRHTNRRLRSFLARESGTLTSNEWRPNDPYHKVGHEMRQHGGLQTAPQIKNGKRYRGDSVQQYCSQYNFQCDRHERNY